MSMPEILGYLASGLVFTTFCMRTIVPLRLVAIASNLAFMAYGLFLDLIPVFVLHAVLLPMNAWRLAQIGRLIRQVTEAARSDLSLGWLLPFMTKRPVRKGEVLFCRGDPAGEMFYIIDGTIRLEELGVSVGPGDLLGEMGMFSPSKERLASAVCETDVELLAITEEKVTQLYFQNPRFGFYMIRLITKRLIEDMAIVQAQHARATASEPSRANGSAAAAQ